MIILLELLILLAAILLRGRFLFGWHLKKHSDNSNYLKYIVRGKKGKIRHQHLGIIQKNTIPFIVKPEKWYHRSLKALGIATELKLSDADFDKLYFITTDYPEKIEQTLKSSPLMSNLEELFQYNVKELYVSSEKIWCVLTKDGFFDDDEQILLTYYQVLEKIAENLSHTYIRTNSFTPRLAALIAICFDAGLISLGILGFALTFIDNIEILDLNEWIIKTCIVGAITSGLWFLLLIKYFRHTSWICWVLADFILVGIAGFILSTLFIIRDINLDLPQPAPTLYFEPIVNKTCTLECSQRQGRRNHSRSYVLSSEQCASSQNRSTAIAYYEQMNSICMYNTSFFFYLDIADWRSKGNYHFSVQEAQYDQSQLGNKVRVPVYPGALGIHWLSHPQLITITESFD